MFKVHQVPVVHIQLKELDALTSTTQPLKSRLSTVVKTLIDKNDFKRTDPVTGIPPLHSRTGSER